ncbi:MAG: GntR family transcriptional regulator [Prevotella sp.]|nr:GntR family transcriptional regulator [Prevotella sp.]
MKLGDYNRLRVIKRVDFGLYLDGGSEGDILLPQKYVPAGIGVGDEVDVFLYLDQDERLIATTEKPLACVGDFAFLEVAWVNKYGAFLNWGLTKDLFCPFREQKQRMEVGRSYIVYVHIDSESYRLVATAKVDKYLNSDPAPYKNGQEVSLLVWQKTDLGFKCIVNNTYAGLIYDDQIYQPVRTGQRLRGYVSQVRGDGKLDISLQPSGRQMTEDFAEELLYYLRSRGGVCPFGDKTDADVIRNEFHVSKKTFKKAVGDLYRRRLIDILPEGLHLLEEE